jgi:hypothetical protein
MPRHDSRIAAGAFVAREARTPWPRCEVLRTRRYCIRGEIQFPDSAESGLLSSGRAERVSGMIRKIITQEFVVPTVLAVALAIVLSIGAIYLTEIFLGPIAQVEAHQPGSP